MLVKWEAPLARFKERVAAGEDIFKPLIQKYMLENPHRVSFKMLPDSKKAAAIEEKERKTLEEYQKSLSPEQVTKFSCLCNAGCTLCLFLLICSSDC